MKKTKYPIDKIIQILAEAELPNNSIADVCRKYSIARSTFDKWRKNIKDFLLLKLKNLKSLKKKMQD